MDEPDKPGGEEPEPEATEGSTEDGSAENERPTVSPPFDPIAFAKEILRPSPAAGIPAARLPNNLGRGGGGLPPGPAGSAGPAAQDAQNDDLHTHATPPQGTEQQAAAAEASRRASSGSEAPPPAAPAAAAAAAAAPPAAASSTTASGGYSRRKTPTSTLSLANARIPSNLPPRLQRLQTSGGLGPAPPSQQPPPAAGSTPPKIESLTSMNAVDREWADLEIATRPPPPDLDGPDEDPVIEILQDRPPQLDLDEIADLDEHSADTVRRPIPEEADFREVLPPDEPPTSSIPGGPRSSLSGGGSGRTDDAVIRPREREMNDRVSLGDYSGALEIAERMLADDPEDVPARNCADNCRTVLRQMYAARIGPLDRVPIVMVPRDQLRWLSIDHKAGFVLSLVDGVSSLEMIIDVSGMPELDTLRILSELAQQRIISLR